MTEENYYYEKEEEKQMKAGDKVEFIGQGPYEYQIDDVFDILVIGGIYTIDKIIKGNWEVSLSLEEFPFLKLNAAMFKSLKKVREKT